MHAPRQLVAAAAILFATSTAGMLAAVIYVNAAATGANNGTSWTNAYTSLQSAIGAAGGGDELWVAAATYKPTPTTDRTISFALKNGLAVYGGFNGTETMRSQRNPAVNVTTLSGDIGTPGMSTDNSYHVVTANGTVTASGVLDGFTITAGQADGANPNDRGGGMWDNGGAPSLGNLIFVANFANFEGGGLRITSGAPTLTKCSFLSNLVGFGGAGGGLKAGGGSTVVATSCVFRSNQISSTSAGGGGIESAGGMTLINCIIAQNDPSGIQFIADSNSLENCTIAGNVGYGATFITSSSNSMTNTIVWANGAGGVFNDGLSVVSVTYSDTQDALTGTGNIAADPLFRGYPTDLRLGAGPAVDSGNNAAVPVGVTTDVAGLPRFFDDPAVPNTGAGTPPIVDMGAHERVPLMVSAPSSLSLCAGANAVFSVTASGQAPLSYQWRENGSPLSDGGRISGSTTSSLTITTTIPGDSGTYDVIVTDGFSQAVTSAPATLTVTARPALPVITAPLFVPVGSTGNTARVVNHIGSTWSWALTGGTITAGQGTSQITYDAGAPGTTIICSVVETASDCSSPQASKLIQVDFLDVPPSNPFHDFVDTVARNGITAGCGGGNYCGTAPITRAQMAVFLLKAEHGSPYVPPPCVGVFADVECTPTPAFAVNWIEQLFHEGITAGCLPAGHYCPDSPVTRAQMAVFLLKTKHGIAYGPPPCVGIFQDVECTPMRAFAVDWIEQLYNENITGGCGLSPLKYCPDRPNTRGEMAVFLTRTFHLQ